jgi:hypothetical protein
MQKKHFLSANLEINKMQLQMKYSLYGEEEHRIGVFRDSYVSFNYGDGSCKCLISLCDFNL